MPGRINLSRKLAFTLLIFVLSASLLQAFPSMHARAQEAAPVQEIQGKINPNELDVFVISGMKKGQTLFAMLETTAGDLDPALSLVEGTVDLPKLISTYRSEVQRIVQTSEFPLAELPALNDKTFLAWDDDSGPGYSAALEFLIPEDGDYILGASGRFPPPVGSLPAITDWCWGWTRRRCWKERRAEWGSRSPSRMRPAWDQPDASRSIKAASTQTGLSITLPLYDFDPGERVIGFRRSDERRPEAHPGAA